VQDTDVHGQPGPPAAAVGDLRDVGEHVGTREGGGFSGAVLAPEPGGATAEYLTIESAAGTGVGADT